MRAIGVAAVAAALFAGSCLGTRRGARSHLSTKEIYDRSKPGIVRIEGSHGDRTAVGTGFVLTTDGRIATNLHVIAGSSSIKVITIDGTQHEVQRVVAVDQQRDLAVVTIRAKGLKPLELGNSDEVAAGDRVVAIGNPLGVLDHTVSDGLISSIRPVDDKITVLQISAPISQGSSGGPLFNPFGEVIGVATFISIKGQNLNFGVPSNYLRPLLAATGGETVAQFAARYAQDDPNQPRITRNVPQHPVSLLDGCSPEQLSQVFEAITGAIEVGAPVYNTGEHEACFVIYRKAVEKLEADPKMCKGVRQAMGQGLLVLETLGEDFTAKAWALRDTFDGMLDVMGRKAGATP